MWEYKPPISLMGLKSQICKLKQPWQDLVSNLVTKGKKQSTSMCFRWRILKKHGYGVANETLLTNLKWFFFKSTYNSFQTHTNVSICHCCCHVSIIWACGLSAVFLCCRLFLSQIYDTLCCCTNFVNSEGQEQPQLSSLWCLRAAKPGPWKKVAVLWRWSVQVWFAATTNTSTLG